MSTQLESAREGRLTPEMRVVAQAEGVAPDALLAAVSGGRVVIPWNRSRKRPPESARGIGAGLRTKVNANLGTSRDVCDIGQEKAKLAAAAAAGADSVMDLSTGGDLRAIRKELIASTPLTFGTVPIYGAAVESARSRGSILEMTPDGMLGAVRRHAEDGVDFVTIHAGVTRRVLAALGEVGKQNAGRLCGIVSRGGMFLAHWMLQNDRENPFYERYDRLLEIAREFDVTLSLGDGLRPGAIADAGDEAQMAELIEIASLVKRARDAGVQAMVEGPGHVPLHLVRSQMEAAKTVTGGAPLYVLGPLVTDVAAGYDHIAGAIGGALAGWAGADFLCVVTPAEHLALPGPEEVRLGVVAARIAAHAADVALDLSGARDWDDEVSRLRSGRGWEALIPKLLDPGRAGALREGGPPEDPETCSMCGPYCVFKTPKSAK